MKKQVVLSGLLPISETVLVCDIKTRRELWVSTGNQIHSLIQGDVIILSQEAYDEFIATPPICARTQFKTHLIAI